MGMMTSTKEAFPAKPASITQSYKVRRLWALVPSARSWTARANRDDGAL